MGVRRTIYNVNSEILHNVRSTYNIVLDKYILRNVKPEKCNTINWDVQQNNKLNVTFDLVI